MEDLCIVDSGASSHMCPRYEAFLSYTETPQAYVTVANNVHVPCVGRGSTLFYLRNKLVLLHNVLHVPTLNSTLYSIADHRRTASYSFVANTSGSFLHFSHFTLEVDDTYECTIPMLFFDPSIPDPTPFPDFTATMIESAAPVTTRAMTRSLPTQVDISQAFTQVPLSSTDGLAETTHSDSNVELLGEHIFKNDSVSSSESESSS